MVSLSLRCNIGWETECSTVPLDPLVNSSYVITEPIFIQRATIENGEANPIIDLDLVDLCNGSPYIPIMGFSIASNARFVELSTKVGVKEFEYIETIRGCLLDLEPGDPQVFNCTSENLLKCSQLRIKFVSIKGTADQVSVVSLKFHSPARGNTAGSNTAGPANLMGSGAGNPSFTNGIGAALNSASAPFTGGGMPSGFSDGGAGQFSIVVEAVKASLLQDFSRLLDAKLTPVIKKLEILDVRMNKLSSEIAVISNSVPIPIAAAASNFEPPPCSLILSDAVACTAEQFDDDFKHDDSYSNIVAQSEEKEEPGGSVVSCRIESARVGSGKGDKQTGATTLLPEQQEELVLPKEEDDKSEM